MSNHTTPERERTPYRQEALDHHLAHPGSDETIRIPRWRTRWTVIWFLVLAPSLLTVGLFIPIRTKVSGPAVLLQTGRIIALLPAQHAARYTPGTRIQWIPRADGAPETGTIESTTDNLSESPDLARYGAAMPGRQPGPSMLVIARCRPPAANTIGQAGNDPKRFGSAELLITSQGLVSALIPELNRARSIN